MQIRRILHKFELILSGHQKMRILQLLVMMIFGGFLEMCSVSLILPFVQIIMNPEPVMSNSHVIGICNTIGVEGQRSLLVLMALVLAVIYILKNVFLLLRLKYENRFIRKNRFALQRKLLENYISRPYEYFLEVNSGEVLRVIVNDTAQTFGLMTTLMTFFSEMIVSLVLIVTIFAISPVITVAMAAMMIVLVLIIMGVLRPILRRASLRRQSSFAAMNKWLLQSIHGIKELKVMRREQFFLNEYTKHGEVYIDALSKSETLSSVPRYMIEAVSMSSFLVVIAVMIYNGTDLESLVPILSVVAMAAIRLLPAVNRISNCLAGMATNEPYLDKMIENLREISNYTNKKIVTPVPGSVHRMADTVKLENVHYQYPSGESEVLDGASFSIHAGESIGIVGASGAGKTTAVDIMLGLLQPQEGIVEVDGTDIRLDMDGWLGQIGYIPQTIFVLDGSVRDNVAFGVPEDQVDDEKIWTALREAALADFVKSLSGGLSTQLGERGVRLSGGQRQRIGIARALYANPEILFFDEATSSLDNETEAEIMEAINQLHGNKTLVIIAHRLSTIEGCDHVYRVENGKIKKER